MLQEDVLVYTDEELVCLGLDRSGAPLPSASHKDGVWGGTRAHAWVWPPVLGLPTYLFPLRGPALPLAWRWMEEEE